MIYLSPKAVKFSFSKWGEGETPLECFDKEDWLGCMHGCLIGLTLIGDSRRTHLTICDDGIVHELLHLHLGIDVSVCATLVELRGEVESIERDLESILEETNDCQ